MERRAITAVVLAVAAITLFVVAASSPQVTYVDGPPEFTVDSDPPPPPPELVEEPPEETLVARRDPIEVPWVVVAIIRVIVVACCVFAAAVVAVYAWRNRPRFRWRRRRRVPDFEPLPDVGAAVTADAAAQRAALSGGTPRNAIVACWLRLEAAVDDAGLHRRAADTSTELVERVLAEWLVDDHALHDLAELYREARFSDHDLGEDRRQAAITALDAVHAGLRQRAHAETSQAQSAGAVASPMVADR